MLNVRPTSAVVVGCGARRPAPTLAILQRRLAQLGILFDRCALPRSLQILIVLGRCFILSMAMANLPSSLLSLTIGEYFFLYMVSYSSSSFPTRLSTSLVCKRAALPSLNIAAATPITC